MNPQYHQTTQSVNQRNRKEEYPQGRRNAISGPSPRSWQDKSLATTYAEIDDHPCVAQVQGTQAKGTSSGWTYIQQTLGLGSLFPPWATPDLPCEWEIAQSKEDMGTKRASTLIPGKKEKEKIS